MPSVRTHQPLFHALAFALAACAGRPGPSAPPPAAQVVPAAAAAPVADTTLNVGLYPFVPRPQQFQDAIGAAWAQAQPGVALNFVEWGGGYDADPAGMDVFVFDAVFLDYFRVKGYLAKLSQAEVQGQQDYLPYAIQGVAYQDGYSAIPMLGCANILFYRQGDAAIANATTLSALEQAVGQCSYTSQVPPDARGLLLDMAGGTTNACLYVDVAESISGQWPPTLPPSPVDLDPTAVKRMQSLLATASYYNATEDPPNGAYGRSAWFSQGNGRIVMGFTESMSAMNAEARSTVQFKVFPLGDDPTARPLFYSDVIAISSATPNRGLAVELANLMASTNVMVASMQATGGQPAQYLMPTRASVFQALSQGDPIYGRMQAMVSSSNPILFNVGPNARDWINGMKNPIKAASRANYACGCDQDGGQLTSQAQANETCPKVCAGFGGWNGQWTPYPPGGTKAWKGGCGCKSCPVEQ
jgi:thiamine pyridinylase